MSYTENTRKVICIGRNFVDHIKELNNQAPSEPFFFLKPTSSILTKNQGPILIPQGATVHHEVELALVIGKTIQNSDFSADKPSQSYLDSIEGYALAIDLTARNVQNEAKKKGLPWTVAKGFDTFLPLSEFIPKPKIEDPENVTLELKVNGEIKQHDPTSLMIFKIPEMLDSISCVMTLEPGDIVLTGTPKGVGPLVPGDKVECSIFGNDGNAILEGNISLDVAQKPGPYQFVEKK